ncbi:MAG: phosphatase PAP2 family protein [Mycobacteriales bacterium]
MLLAAAAAVFALQVALFGFPTGREVLTGWVLVFLLAACAGRLRPWARAVLHDWLPLFAVLFAYDLMRGLAPRVGAALGSLPRLHADADNPDAIVHAHLMEPIRADRFLFHGYVPTIWLQQHLYTAGTVHWWDALAVPVYFSHFVVSLAVAVALWVLNYDVFGRYLRTLLTLTGLTLLTYGLFPAAPPWMAGLPANHTLPNVARVIQVTLDSLGGHTVNSAFEHGEAYSNPVAAMPSLHGAIPMMLLLFAWPLVRARTRVLLAGYAVSMAAVLVYAGEHYVTDILVGYLYAAAAVFGVRYWQRSATGTQHATVTSPELLVSGQGPTTGPR